MSEGHGQRWGWHQLSDRWAQRLVDNARIEPGDLVVDVGAGTGALTAPLVAAGARVIAVELHPRRADVLRARFARDAVTVVQVDAADLRLPRKPYKVVANPPFAVTAALLRSLLAPGTHLTRADLVLPRPIAARWANGRGRASARWATTFDAGIPTLVPRTAFRPAPPREVAVLVLVRRT